MASTSKQAPCISCGSSAEFDYDPVRAALTCKSCGSVQPSSDSLGLEVLTDRRLEEEGHNKGRTYLAGGGTSYVGEGRHLGDTSGVYHEKRKVSSMLIDRL